MRAEIRYTLLGMLLGVALSILGAGAFVAYLTHGRPAEIPRCQHAPGFAELRIERPYTKYEIDDARKKRILNNYNLLQVGMTEQQVWELFGEPNVAQEGWAKEPDRGCRGTAWQYWFELKHDAPNAYDKMLQVFFSQGGKVNWVVPPYGMGLPEKGSPRSE